MFLPSIVKTWKLAGSWKKDEQESVPDLEGINKCESMVDSDADQDAVSSFINDPENTSSSTSMSYQTSAVKELIEFVSKRSGISVISMSDMC